MSATLVEEDRRPRLIGAVLAPLAVLAAALAVWWVSDRLITIGPFDRAVVGWGAVIPLWALSAVAAGFAWRPLTPSLRLRAALACAMVIGMVGAAMLWSASAFPDCDDGARRSPAEWVVLASGFGAILGIGFAWSGLSASRLVTEGRTLVALVIGSAAQLTVVVMALGYILLISPGNGCNRPL